MPRCCRKTPMLKRNDQLRIAWFSPCAGERPGEGESIPAYVSAQIVPRLADDYTVDLYHPGGLCSFAGVTCYPCRSVLKRHSEEPYDLFFYQVADTPQCDFTRCYLSLLPGVVWFYDVFFRPRAFSGAADAVCRKADAFLADFLQSPPDTAAAEGAFARREAQYAALSLFSAERNIAEFKRRRGPGIAAQSGIDRDAYFLPYPVSPLAGRSPASGAEPSDGLTVAFCGTVLLEHRAHYLLSVLSGLRVPWKLLWMLDESEVGEAKRLAAEFGAQNVEFVTPRSNGHWSEAVAWADVAVHLLFSAYGDPGPELAASMMAGVPCVVSDFSAAALLPDQAVWKIACGEKEASELEIALLSCVPGRRSNEAKRCAALGRTYAEEHNSAGCVTAELKYVLEQNVEQLRTLTKKWLRAYGEEIRSVLEEMPE